MPRKELDRTDISLLNLLQQDSSLTNKELARRVELSPGPTLTRVKRLQELGYIRAYHAQIDAERLGYHVYHHLLVKISAGDSPRERFELFVAEEDCVLWGMELHRAHPVGGARYQLVVVHKSKTRFEDWLRKHLMEREYLQDVEVWPVEGLIKAGTQVRLGYEDAEAPSREPIS